MDRIKDLIKLKKSDGVLINFLKICFRLITLFFFYYLVGGLIGELRTLLNPSRPQLPSAISPVKVWMLYTAAYLLAGGFHTVLLKSIRFVRKKLNKGAVEN